MNTPKISVIVPVYNDEKYIERCIKSILAQSFEDFELILTDDGSTDGSGKICDKFAADDKRIKTLHAKNRGVSRARNDSLKIATGKRICFVDSDDYVEKDYLKVLFEAAEKYKADIAICGVRLRDENNTGSDSEAKPAKDYLINRSDFSKYMHILLEQKKLNYVYAKIYKSEIIKNNNILFDIKTSLGEDTIFVCDILKHTNRISVVGGNYYNYEKHASERLTNKYRENIFGIYLKISKHIEKTMRDLGCMNKEMMNVIDDRKINSVIWSVLSIKNQKRIKKSMKIELIKEIIRNKEFTESFERRKSEFDRKETRIMASGNARRLLRFYRLEPLVSRIKGVLKK